MNAITLEIPRQQWLTYFNTIGKVYQGWGVTVEVLGRDLGDQPEDEGSPLQGISFDPAGSDAGTIRIEVGDAEPGFATHRVERPRAVRASETLPGAEVDIQIESEDGTSTLVRMRPRPELSPAPA